jgi:hypothetical protein
VTINKDLEYVWNGVDTNFVWRGPKGIRVNGGTSTGRTQRDTCFATLDNLNVQGRVGAEYRAGCRAQTPFQTNVRGSAAYVVPWADVLVSLVFQSLPGVEQTATLTYNKDDITWNPDSAARATQPCLNAANGVGCLGTTRNTTTTNVGLLLSNEYFGERVTTFDMKFAKNFRFANRRATFGVDVYNIFNSDAITAYNGTYTPDDPNTAANENHWLEPTGLVAARFVRLSIQVSF